MSQIDMTELSETQVQGLRSLTGRKARTDYLEVVVAYLRLNQRDPVTARNYFLIESAKIHNFGRDFIGVDGLEDGVECYSPTIDRFLLIDPNGLSDVKISPHEFKVFLRSGATSEWEGGGPGEDGYTHVGERLSTIEAPNKFFPGYQCIDQAVDGRLRETYRASGFNIPERRK